MVRIRLATAADGHDLAAIYAPIVTDTAVSFETEPPSGSEMTRRITAGLPVHPWLVAEDEGGVQGYAYAGPYRTRAAYRWAVDVSAYVHRDHHRRSVGRTLYTALLGILEAQGYRRAHAGIALPNPASVGLHVSTGFELVGIYREVGWKLGRWHDVGWWQRRLGTGDEAPTEPRGVDEIEPEVLAKWLS